MPNRIVLAKHLNGYFILDFSCGIENDKYLKLQCDGNGFKMEKFYISWVLYEYNFR